MQWSIGRSDMCDIAPQLDTLVLLHAQVCSCVLLLRVALRVLLQR